MDRGKLYDLEEAIQRFSDGLDAIRMMVMGLEQVQDANTGGFYAIWRYLDEVDREVKRCLGVCLGTD